MKKTLLLGSIVLASVMAGGSSKYASKQQALEACNEWILGETIVDYTQEKDDFQKGVDFDKNVIFEDIVTEAQIKDLNKRKKEYVNSTQYYEKSINENAFNARHCHLERDTKQWLGMENELVLNGGYDFKKGIRGTYKAVKSFRY